jgi:hypothetical protein
MYVGDGMPCGVVGGTYVGCGQGGGCYTSTGPTSTGQTGTCKAAVREGAACDNVVGPPCLPPGRCIDGTCFIPDANKCG